MIKYKLPLTMLFERYYSQLCNFKNPWLANNQEKVFVYKISEGYELKV